MDLEKRMRESTERGEGVLMPHVYYGDPTQEFSRRLISMMAENGADIIEYGIPFSDPTADGPTFQAACERALRRGVTPHECLRDLRQLRERGLTTPVIVTTYYNIPYVMGVGDFLREIVSVKAQGVIIPNLPFEEADSLLIQAQEHGIHVILMVAPTTTEERLKRIAVAASGFIYVMNVEGVTGARETLGNQTLKLIQRVRQHTDIPIMAGFGISNGDQAAAVTEAGADGVIAGSVFSKIYEANLCEPCDSLSEITRLVRELKEGCNEGIGRRRGR
jgi:tryptophan synthase alpha chain